ncbi:FtsX-like permease family protein [Marinifilum fragile]|uniref:ABC transporter permease n=1 Tax=Marinifilum fragile TaxID=570161 RepID=UPI002AA63A20|nr:FtsX-like permease family protein [Marinifilum fragile]
MISKHLKSFLIHLWKNKLYSVITIFGFSISLMFILLLSIYIKNEYSADQFHEKKDRIYRMTHGEECGFAPPSGPLLMETYPEIENYCRTRALEGFLKSGDSSKLKADLMFADSSFLNMFTFKMLKGSPSMALAQKNTMVLTKSFAYKMFGKLPEIGTKVTLNDIADFEVTGIIEDIPTKTHFKNFEVLVNFPTMGDVYGSNNFLTSYDSNSYGLYVLCKPGTNFPEKADEVLELFKGVNWMFQRGYVTTVEIEPITDSYFSKSISYNSQNKSKRFVLVLTAIVILILVLSIINYVNLTIAQSSFRSREIAVRKLIGGKKPLLLVQSLTESVLICFVSLVIAIALSFQVESVFNYLLNTDINILSEFTGANIFKLILFMVLIAGIAGIVPALKIASFDPILVMKGKYRMKEKSVYSKIMLSFQYVIIITLITCAFFISKQTSYLRNYQLGFEKENMLTFECDIPAQKQRVLKEVFQNIPGVEEVCLSCGTPLDGGNNGCFTYNDKQVSFQHFYVDTCFFKMMDIPVRKTGVGYAQDMVWMNEKALKVLELPENAINFKQNDKNYPIYGVTKDFHFRDLTYELGPAIFRILSPEETAWSFTIKMNGKNNYETIQKIKQAHSDFTNGIPLKIEFFNESVQAWYDKEEKTGKIVKYFAILTVIISVMGLFAMSLYYVQQKQKEIGVRKVNGAKTHEIIRMLNKDYSIWVIFAFILSCPISYYSLNKWLESFAYKTELSWWIFALAGIIALGIALLTVSWQSWRAAKRNPVESLRYE